MERTLTNYSLRATQSLVALFICIIAFATFSTFLEYFNVSQSISVLIPFIIVGSGAVLYLFYQHGYSLPIMTYTSSEKKAAVKTIQMQAEIEELKREIERWRFDDAHNASINQQQAVEIQTLQTKLEKAEMESHSTKRDLDHQEEVIGHMKETITSLKETKASFKETITSLRDDRNSLEESLKEIEHCLKDDEEVFLKLDKIIHRKKYDYENGDILVEIWNTLQGRVASVKQTSIIIKSIKESIEKSQKNEQEKNED